MKIGIGSQWESPETLMDVVVEDIREVVTISSSKRAKDSRTLIETYIDFSYIGFRGVLEMATYPLESFLQVFTPKSNPFLEELERIYAKSPGTSSHPR